MFSILRASLPVFSGMVILAAAPSSTNYTLKSYDLGGTGGSGSSTNFKLDANAGTQSGASMTSTSYAIDPGEIATQNAAVPPAPTFTNPSNEYNRLRITLNTGGNPTDTRYAIAISPDAFTTTYYVQTDNTIGASYSITNYQTYAVWGSGSGVWITGLTPGTTYTVKIAAYQGDFTNTKFGPTASAATVQPTLSFSVETSASSTPPFAVAFNGLIAGVVGDSAADAVLTMTTNALSGGSTFVRSVNAGLTSPSASFTINSATTDLAVAASGYGARVVATSESSGGPVAASAPFNGSNDSVGGLTAGLQEVSSVPAPVTSGVTTVRLKAKTTAIMPSAVDYTDTLTFVAAMQF
jgi:hypothetical protein